VLEEEEDGGLLNEDEDPEEGENNDHKFAENPQVDPSCISRPISGKSPDLSAIS